jgi:hypothetical protein
MRVAVTDHAVKRFRERVEGAASFDEDSVRLLIRSLVHDGFVEGSVRPHPKKFGRRIIPFSSGSSVLYLSLGPNETKVPADFAVVGVMFEKELGGKVESGVTLGDVFPTLVKMNLAKAPPRFIGCIVEDGVEERYDLGGVRELRRLAANLGEKLRVYQLLDDEEVRKLM